MLKRYAGKKTKRNKLINRDLKKRAFDKNIPLVCCLRFDGCKRTPVHWAHSTRRINFDSYEKEREAVPACVECHFKLDNDFREDAEQIVKEKLIELDTVFIEPA